MLAEIFAQQADICRKLGSPFMGRLMDLFAKNWDQSPAVRDMLCAWIGQPDVTAGVLPLRIAGALHALALMKKDAGLCAVYPPNFVADTVLWQAVTDALHAQGPFVSQWLEFAPQTNEIRRSAAIWAAAQMVHHRFKRPLALYELGASAGLNLNFDRYRVVTERFSSIPNDPILDLAPEWRGQHPTPTPIVVSQRSGVDLNPLDPSCPDDMLRLKAYTWPDQQDRLDRLDLAAPYQTTTVDQEDAAIWLARELRAAPKDSVPFVFSTVAWQYFDAKTQEACRHVLHDGACQVGRVAQFMMETDGRSDSALLSLQIWPSGQMIELGRADYHGRWIDWSLTSDVLTSG